MSRILIAETQKDLATALKEYFSSNRYTVEIESNGLRILESLRKNQYDVIVLEIALPGMDGIAVVREYRASGGSTPILLMAPRHSSEELQRGLDAGADSYLVKPFKLVDLAAQLRAMLRRTALRNGRILKAGVIAMDTDAGTVTIDKIPIHLHPMEFKLLQFLLRHPNQVFDAVAIYERVWNKDDGASYDTVRTHVRSLRRKMDSLGIAPTIVTVRGLGYKIEK